MGSNYKKKISKLIFGSFAGSDLKAISVRFGVTKNRTLFMDVPFPNCFLKNEVWRTFKVDFSLRDHPFKTSAKFYAIIDPSPPQCIHMEVKVAV